MSPRVSSLDEDYTTGDLSLYPQIIDDKSILYQVKNNAETKLKQTLAYNGKYIVVEDTSAFPPNGLLSVGVKGQVSEIVYYGKKTATVFSELIRGFVGSRQNMWPSDITYVSNAVMAETHNAVKDALLNLETNLGTKDFPDPNSLNGILKSLENKFLAPKPSFRAYPRIGTSPLKIRFQNFSEGGAIRFLWNFGDGSTSIERNPTHTYTANGSYTVQLNVITSTGAQGIAVKEDYIILSDEETVPFFYFQLKNPNQPAYSIQTAQALNKTPAEFVFVDQTDGDIAQRYWVFDDGMAETKNDPDIHTISHLYEKPGEYEPSLIVFFTNDKLKRIFLSQKVVVL